MSRSRGNVLVVLPFGFTSQLLIKELLSNGYNIDMFELEGFDSNHLTEVANDLLGYSTLTDMSYVPLISLKDWSNYDIVVFPALNLNPEEEANTFWILCSGLFRSLTDTVFKSDVTILFGQNTWGLVAAYHLGVAKPEVKNRIFVLSSIYELVKKICGDEQKAISLPDGQIYFSDPNLESCNKVSFLNGAWKFDQFAVLEATVLFNAVEAIISSCFSAKFLMIGKFYEDQISWRFNGIDLSVEEYEQVSAIEDWIRNRSNQRIHYYILRVFLNRSNSNPHISHTQFAF